jgi:hypothetical protein
MFTEQHQEMRHDCSSLFDGGESPRPDKGRFMARFESELQRLREADRELTSWEEENLLGALGAASLGEHDLACGMIEASKRPPPASSAHQREFRRQPLPLATLRRRFERLR